MGDLNLGEVGMWGGLGKKAGGGRREEAGSVDGMWNE